MVLDIKIDLPAYVRTAHDLLRAIERKEIEVSAAQAKAIKAAIG